MKFNVSSATLCNRLQTLSRVIASKNSIQILDCILFELQDGQLRLKASDSETTLVSTLNVDEADSNGVFAIKAATIINGLKEIADQPITLEVNPETHEIVIFYQNGRSSFVGQGGEEYPVYPDIKDDAQQLSIDTNVLLNGISRAIFATAEDEIRPVMNGIYFDITPDSVTFVASDGHKLVRDRSYTTHGGEQPSAFILPKKPAKMLKDILAKESGDAIVKFDDRNARVELENYVLSCRLIEGRYPNYNSVIPQDNPFRVTVDRVTLIGALRRVLVFASTATSLVKLRVDQNDLTVSTQDIDFSTSAEEHVLCDYSGTAMSIGFKGPFLVDILNSMASQEVVLELADPSRAGVIVPAEQEEQEDLLMLLMPMMLNE
ncbi:MAG: DNA polymerase III subunit beta [Bacteroidaceae bacterium]|nr:DNA polymerase III subunit beta [Bacteroidaceae bacterium]MBR3530119.1 DNA polymerase III subunit beta [Bacteroidaceae bacterium]